MSVESIAKRYARALFEIGVETGSLSRVTEEVGAFANAYSSSPELRVVLVDPLVPETDRNAVLDEISKRIGAGDITRNTMRLLAKRRRMPILPTMSKELLCMADEKQGLMRARVTSAKPLTEEYARRLQTSIEQMMGKRIVLSQEVDPSLIAGIITRVGDTVIDGSLRTRLIDLKSQLLSG